MSDFASVLDNPAELRRFDPKDILGLAVRFPEQCAEAISIFESSGFVPLQGGIRNVVVCGMGGSAAGGDLLRCVAEDSGSAPINVVREYEIPAYCDEKTWAIFCSYSGNTEETLSCYKDARAKRCQRLCITSGGKLGELAATERVPCLKIPGGQPPRTALGYLFLPLLLAATRTRVVSANAGSIPGELTHQLRRYGPESPFADNPAKQLAAALYGRIPILYGLGGYRSVVASRWKGQINENAKVHCFHHGLPEMCHNEIVGWTLAGRQSPGFAVVFLTDGTESPQMQTRMRVVRDILGAAPVHEVRVEGPSLVAKMLSLCYIGDFVSLYLARLNEADPEQIVNIDHLKSELGKLQPG